MGSSFFGADFFVAIAFSPFGKTKKIWTAIAYKKTPSGGRELRKIGRNFHI
jgi:hypothetical protein